MAAATRGGEIPHIRRTTVSSRKSLRDGEERTRVKGKKKSACCVRSRKTIRDANDANDGLGMRPCCPASSPVTGVCVWRCGRRRRGRWRFCLRCGERRSGSRRPEDVEFFFEVGEVFVAGGEKGFCERRRGLHGRCYKMRRDSSLRRPTLSQGAKGPAKIGMLRSVP